MDFLVFEFFIELKIEYLQSLSGTQD